MARCGIRSLRCGHATRPLRRSGLALLLRLALLGNLRLRLSREVALLVLLVIGVKEVFVDSLEVDRVPGLRHDGRSGNADLEEAGLFGPAFGAHQRSEED